MAEAIESVLKQTRLPDEVIVLDDASTDNAAAVAQRYPVVYIRNKHNLGTVANLNQGIAMANGDYVMSLDADNRLQPDYLAKTAAVLDECPAVAIAYTGMALFGPYAGEIYHRQPAWQAGQGGEFYWWRVPEFNLRRLKWGNYIHGSSLFRKIAYVQVGGYPNTKAEDWQLWKKITQLGWQAKLVPECLLEYRQHSPEQRNLASRSSSLSWLKLTSKIILAKFKLF